MIIGTEQSAEPPQNKKVLLVTRRDGLAELEVVYDRLSKPIWGGHSDTFIGENSEFGRVAIKRLRAKIIGGRENAVRAATFVCGWVFADDPLQRFDREQCVWEGLDHPNILGFVGTTDIDDVPALVSLWMDNGNAREYVEKDVNHTLSRFKLVGAQLCSLDSDLRLMPAPGISIGRSPRVSSPPPQEDYSRRLERGKYAAGQRSERQTMRLRLYESGQYQH